MFEGAGGNSTDPNPPTSTDPIKFDLASRFVLVTW